MIHLNLEMAGIPFEVEVLFERTADILKPYQSNRSPAFSAVITREELELEQEYTRETAMLENLTADNFSAPALEYTAIHRLISEEMIERNVLLFHGSALSMDGQGFLFTAPSGTGKSTHSSYWRKAFGERVTMVNDDKPFLRFEPDGQVLVCGSAWNGKHRLGQNITVPLRAVFLLNRGEENRAEPIAADAAFPSLFRQCYHSQNPEREIQVLSMLDQLGKNVPLYELWCNMSVEAAQTACAAIHR